MGVRTCDICSSSEYVIVCREGRFRTPVQNVVCQTCGFVYVNPPPSRPEIRNFYSQLYDSSGLFFQNNVPLGELDESGLGVARARLDFLKRHMPRFESGLALDVGCGTGTFLGLLAREEWNVWGVEPVPRLARYATEKHEAKVRVGLFEDCDFGTTKFDLITLFHVLEHVWSPSQVLQRCRGLLTAKGILYIEVPDLFHPNRARPEDFFQIAHLSTFSANTLARLLVKECFESVCVARYGYFLRAIARPIPDDRFVVVGKDVCTAAEVPADDWLGIVRMIEFRRRWYLLTGFWQDLLSDVNGASRRMVRRIIISLIGPERGRRIVSWLRRM